SGEPAGPLWQLSASDLAAAYVPREVVAATFERVEAVNPRLNALITLDEDGARAAADASAERWRAGQARGPLDGVPITIKDSLFGRSVRNLGQPALCRPRSAHGRNAGRSPARGWGGDSGQDERAGIHGPRLHRQSIVRANAKSVEHRPHTRRLERRRRGCGRGRTWCARDRH